MLSPPKEAAIPVAPTNDMPPVPKRTFSIFGARKPKSRPRHNSPEQKLDAARKETANARRRSITTIQNPTGDSDSLEKTEEKKEPLGYRTFSFKFSLEWQHNQFMSIAERRAFHSDLLLFLPRLPAPAYNYLIVNVPGTADDVACIDPATRTGKKYAGRALAEWQQVVSEHDNFIERRLSEGDRKSVV